MLELLNKRGVQLGSVAVAVALTASLLPGASVSRRILYSVLAAAITYVYIAIPAWWRKQRLERNPRWRLYLKSLAVQRWVQYASASKATSEIGLEFGKALIARGKLSEELALSERPVTELALVTEFRKLAEELAALNMPVVIAIDELDKIGAVEDVRKLLRSVKGVLDPAGVVLLVSVSDEAVTHLGLSGLRGRDEISSSFNSMIQVPPLTRDELRTLLREPLVDSNEIVADSVWILTAGNQREAVRLLDRCLATVPAHQLTAEICIDIASASEAGELLNALVVDRSIGEEQKTHAYGVVDRWRTDRPKQVQETLEYWQPQWASIDGWPADVAEEWRRFIIRQALRLETAQALHAPVPGALDRRSRAFLLSQHSASVARHLLEAGSRTRAGLSEPAATERLPENRRRASVVTDSFRKLWERCSRP